MDGGVTAIGCAWHIIQVQGQDTSGTIVQSNLGATAQTGTSSTVTQSAASAAANRFFSYHIHRAQEVTTPRTNWTELDDRNGTAPNMGFEVQWRDDGTNETTATASWTSSVRWQCLALEVKAATAGSVSLDGQSDGTSTVTGDMILQIALAGQSDGTSSDSADMILQIALNAQSDGTSTATGTLSGDVPLAGQSDGTSTVTGDMILSLALAGQSDGTSAVSADLIVGTLVPLDGGSDGLSNAFGDLGFFVQEGLVSVQVRSVLDYKGRERTRVVVRSR
jgi:hypothetical protein